MIAKNFCFHYKTRDLKKVNSGLNKKYTIKENGERELSS